MLSACLLVGCNANKVKPLEGRSQELHDLIVSDNKAAAYLKDKGATSITVAFNTIWEKQGEYFYTYKYELAK